MRLHYFPRTALWLFCLTYVSAIDRMAQYPPFEEQIGLVDRQQSSCPEATETLCPTGNVCCPSGAACYTSNGVPLCNESCPVVAVTCVVNNILACCEVGQECSPSGCISGGSGSGPTITGASSATSSGALPQTTPTPPGAAATTSFGCGTDNACSQGILTWCCSQSLTCDFASPGFCLEFSTSSRLIVTTSNTQSTMSNMPFTTNVASLPTSHATSAGLAAPNILAEGMLAKIWTCFAAMGVALGL